MSRAMTTPIPTPPPLEARPGGGFALTSDFKPAGDQPQAIAELLKGAERGERDQVLLGVTGSGKTFTVPR